MSTELSTETSDYRIEPGENMGWGGVAADKLMELCDDIARQTGIVSETRFIQRYPANSKLVPHVDKGMPSRIVGLTGSGTFYLHSTEEGQPIIQEFVINPGDVLRFSGNGLHSAANL